MKKPPTFYCNLVFFQIFLLLCNTSEIFESLKAEVMSLNILYGGFFIYVYS